MTALDRFADLVPSDHGLSVVNTLTVDGGIQSQIIGPDDPCDGVDADGLRQLLRAVFRAAGGEHEDWDEYDRVMAAERRAAVLVAPRRVYSNPQAG